MLRVLSSAAAYGILVLLLSAHPAMAWDTCLKPVGARGDWVKGRQAAFANATYAWERKIRRVHGRRFANWWYSGDRLAECEWNARGYYRCVVDAQPCARR